MILLTGASGFIGKHLLQAFAGEYGARNILAFTSAPVSDSPFLLHNNYNFHPDYFLKAGFAAINTIVHAGAYIPKSSTQINEWQKCNTNISNTDKLLKANLPKLEKIIYLSTADVYETVGIITEDSPIMPASLYGDSKLYVERMITAWAAAENKICHLLRLGHVYGAGEDEYQKVIPLLIKKLLANQPVQIWGAGNELRSFIYIQDVVKAILSSLNLTMSIGPVNIVSSQAVSINELVEKLIIISKSKPIIERVISKVLSRNLVFDNTKMKRYLLNNETPLEDGLSAEWQYMKQKRG